MWSPQKYVELAKTAGLEKETVDAVIKWIERIGVTENSPAIVLTLKHLAERTKVDYKFLRCIVNRKNRSAYRVFRIKKRSGGFRYIHAPEYKLARVQKWINKFILSKSKVNEASFAFAPGSSIFDCAARHCNSKWLIKLDITGFFESISEIQVFNAFKKLGYNQLLAFELARIVTVESNSIKRMSDSFWKVRKKNVKIPWYTTKTLGYLPQGAPTSPMLSNLVMMELDEEITNLSKKNNLVYTRYSDDMTFSTKSIDFNRKDAINFISSINELLTQNGFRPQYKKTTVIPPGARKIVLGVNVDGKIPKLRKEFKDRIRMHIHYLNKFGPVHHKKIRNFGSLVGMKMHIRGLIDYSKIIEPIFAEKMLEQFNKIEWPEYYNE